MEGLNKYWVKGNGGCEYSQEELKREIWSNLRELANEGYKKRSERLEQAFKEQEANECFYKSNLRRQPISERTYKKKYLDKLNT